MAVVVDDVAGVEGARLLPAEDVIEPDVGGDRAEGVLGLGGGHGELGVVAGDEVLQGSVGLLQRRGTGEAEFEDQALLEGAEGPLDAAFGLRGVGPDVLDAELTQDTADLGEGLGKTEELFRYAYGTGRFGREEQGVAVGVDGERDAVAGDEFARRP